MTIGITELPEGWKYPTTFSMGTLTALEDACRCGIFAIVDRFRATRPERRILDGVELTDAQLAEISEEDRDRLEASASARAEAVRSLQLSHVAEFCAGCLGIPVPEFNAKVTPARALEIFGELQEPFWTALGEMQGDGADPTTPSEPPRTSA